MLIKKIAKTLIAVSSIIISSQGLAANESANFFCPLTILCYVKDLNSPPICKPFPPTWSMTSFGKGGSPQIAGKTIPLHFTNAQSGSIGTVNSNCNYAYIDGTNGNYFISLSSDNYAAPANVHGTNWTPNNPQYCYSLNYFDPTPNYPIHCPFVS